MTRFRQCQRILAARQKLSSQHAFKQLDAACARQMVITNARLTQCRIAWTGPHALVPGPACQEHEALQGMGNVRAREPDVAIPALSERRDQARLFELGHVRTCCW